MRAKRTLWFFAIAAIAGCGDILGLDGYTDQDGALDATADVTADAKTTDAPSGDANPDVSPVDAGSDVAPPGCPGALLCVTAAPSGWSWAVYDPDARPACAAGYVAPSDVEEGIDAGPAKCGCGCTTTQPSCSTGNLTFNYGNGGCNSNNQTDPANTGACAALGNSFSTGGGSSKVAITGPAPSGGSCTSTPSKTVPPVDYDHQGRTCAFDGGLIGCDAGAVCMPDPKPFGLCIAQPGTSACPAGFPTQHVVGTSVTDTRDCTTCGCTFDAGTCSGTTTLYTMSNCTGGSQSAVATDGTCTNAGSHTWRGYAYAPTTNASCTASTASPDGGVDFADTTTICCQ